jgi:hypothetical protein
MPDESVMDIVRRVRGALQDKGSLGAFMLAELDAAIARGVDEGPEDDRKANTSSKSSGRRSPTETELLGILQGVFQTYLVTLPLVAKELDARLHEKFGVDHSEISLDRSLLGDELQLTGRARTDAVVPPVLDDKVAKAVTAIGQIVRERSE